MVDRPDLTPAVAKTKNKASVWNENVNKIMKYTEDCIDEMETWVTNTVDIPITTLATSGEISLVDKSINRIAPTGTVTFTLPVVTDNTKFHQILIQMYLASAQTINLVPSGATVKYFYGIEPDFTDTGYYDIIYEYDGASWCVGAIRKAL